jgi:hypothetical protein
LVWYIPQEAILSTQIVKGVVLKDEPEVDERCHVLTILQGFRV